MPLASYSAGSLGPSPGAAIDTLKAQDTQTNAFNQADLNVNSGFLKDQFTQATMPQLKSSLGAAGQYGSTAGMAQEGQAQLQYKHQQYDLQSAFNRSQMDMKRQEVFAGMGLVLGA